MSPGHQQGPAHTSLTSGAQMRKGQCWVTGDAGDGACLGICTDALPPCVPEPHDALAPETPPRQS
eukprot:3636504-Alexandrium_andersonii.AAC.1